MKVSEASDSEVNEFVAGVFEPLDSTPIHGKNGVWTTPEGHWFTTPGYDQKPQRGAFKVRDFVNTGVGLLFMLGKMKAGGVMFVPEDKMWRAFSDYSMFHEATEYENETEAVTIGRAVAEAFCLANDWKEC